MIVMKIQELRFADIEVSVYLYYIMMGKDLIIILYFIYNGYQPRNEKKPLFIKTVFDSSGS